LQHNGKLVKEATVFFKTFVANNFQFLLPYHKKRRFL